MRKDITVTAEVRTTRGKNEARRLRVRGFIPAVLYGAYKDSVAVGLNPKELTKILNSTTGHNTIFNLAIEGGENTPVMVVDSQRDPIKGKMLHADLKRIDLDQAHSRFGPRDHRRRGRRHQAAGRIARDHLARDRNRVPAGRDPRALRGRRRELMIGQSVRAGGIPMTGSMRLMGPADSVIAHVVAMRAEEVAPAVAAEVAPTAEAGAEPEVIKKGKKEEEGEAGGEKPKKK